MLSIADDMKEKLLDYRTVNELEIAVYHNGKETNVITEDNIVSESMTLKQSICDEERLRFGGCISSEFSVQIMNTEDKTFSATSLNPDVIALKDKYIAVKLIQTYVDKPLYPSKSLFPSKILFPGYTTGGREFTIFYGKVSSLERMSDNRNVFELIAYDPISELFDADKSDISNKVNKLFSKGEGTIPNLTDICLKGIECPASDIERAGLSDTSLVNHDWENSNEKITKGEMLRDICEVCGCYGFYRPSERKFRFLAFDDGIRGEEEYKNYENLNISDNFPSYYAGIIFNYAGDLATDRNKRNGDWGGKIGYYDDDCLDELSELKTEITEGVLAYDMTDNILAYDYTNSGGPTELAQIKPIYERFKQSMQQSGETLYTPLQLTAEGKMWVEVGDTIYVTEPVTNIYGEYLDANGDVVDDYEDADTTTYTSRVLSRTLTGIKALTDTIEVKGET